MRKLVVLLVLLVLAALGTYVGAGFLAPPGLAIVKPERFVGAATPVEVHVEAPGGAVSSLKIEFEQNGARTDVFSVAGPLTGALADPAQPNRLRLTRPVGREQVPTLANGPARLIVTAVRPVLFGLRQIEARTTRDVVVRLDPPRVSVASTHHFINLGGSEAVVYRVTPSDVQSGVIVGDLEYPGFPIAGATVPGLDVSDPSMRVAFFALLHDQPLNTPMHLFARDEAGNTARGTFDYRTFPKPFKQSRIEITDKLLERVVPAILAGTTEVKPTGALVEQFVVLNGDLRRRNAEKIASFARQTAPEMLWQGAVFHPFTNSSAESAFADRRTYFYQGKEIDKQVHLGFDLASYANTPIVAANRGKVVFAEELGIYGTCVIIDHGMGVQSLYAHLSSAGVKAGDQVDKGQTIGRSGMTGMAGGDHLHFTMLVNGHMVNPIEWWDSHWIEDRVIRKLRGQ